ncbi:MAG: hypothetical protein QXT84_06985 [Candidatus Bathyarchaeia archaeon]
MEKGSKCIKNFIFINLKKINIIFRGGFLSQTITEKDILDLAAKIAVQARLDPKIDKSQIENLIASLEGASDPENSPIITAIYAHRQAGRNEIGYETAKLISETMCKLYSLRYKKDDARRLLVLAKWIYESFDVFGKEEKDKEKRERIIREKIREKLSGNIKELTIQDVLRILSKNS